MARMRFMYDNLIDDATITASSEATDFPVSNLQHEWFKRHWRSTGVASEWVKFDLGSAQNVTAIVIKYHNFTGAATIHIQANATDDWGAPSVDVTLTVTSDIIEYYWAVAQSYRWWRLTIADAGNGDGYIRAGRLFLGAYFVPTWNFVSGYSVEKIDPSVLVESTGGQVSADDRPQYRQWIFDFNGISAANKVILEAIFDIVGRKKPYFVSQNPDDGSTVLYYVRNMTDWKFNQIVLGWYKFQLNIREER